MIIKHIKKHEGPDVLLASNFDLNMMSSFLSLLSDIKDINMVTRRCKSLRFDMSNINDEILVLTSKNEKIPVIVKWSDTPEYRCIIASSETMSVIKSSCENYVTVKFIVPEDVPKEEEILVIEPPPVPIEIPEVFKAPRKKKPARPVLET